MMDDNKSFPNWLNRIFKWTQLHNFKGKYHLYKWGCQSPLKRYLIKHTIDKKNFYVPWDQWCFWLEKGPTNYYPEDIQPFTQQINKLKGTTCLLDLGADIGVVSRLISQACPSISLIIALEPNPKAFKILELNFAPLKKSICLNQAIADFEGSTQFLADKNLLSDHEGHINPNMPGNTKVTTLDALYQQYLESLNINNLAIKIDVEGQEKAVFKGAQHAISNTQNVLVLIEIHPGVLARDNISAEDIFTQAEKIRPFTWLVQSAESKLSLVDRKQSFFQQFKNRQYDVIGIAN